MVSQLKGRSRFKAVSTCPGQSRKILNGLESHRDISLITKEGPLYCLTSQGTMPSSLFYQLRQDGDEQFLFIWSATPTLKIPLNARYPLEARGSLLFWTLSQEKPARYSQQIKAVGQL
jgi:hypothetical protein